MIILSIVIFCLVLLLYVHVMFHLKVSNSLDVYDLGIVSKDKLEKACNLRQPLKFKCTFPALKNGLVTDVMRENYGSQTVNVVNISDNATLPLQLDKAVKIFKSDKTSGYYSADNRDFIHQTGLLKLFRAENSYLKPTLTTNTNYDVIWSINGGSTCLSYTLYYRNYYYVTQGKCVIRLFPPNSDSLYCNPDYSQLKFVSPINPFIPNEQYKDTLSRCQYTDIFLKEDDIIFIPPYWRYAIKFIDTCSIAVYQYGTLMSNLAIAPHLFRYVLQRHNISFTPKHIVSTAEKLDKAKKVNKAKIEKTSVADNTSKS